MENPIKMDYLGIPLFLEPPIWIHAFFGIRHQARKSCVTAGLFLLKLRKRYALTIMVPENSAPLGHRINPWFKMQIDLVALPLRHWCLCRAKKGR